MKQNLYSGTQLKKRKKHERGFYSKQNSKQKFSYYILFKNCWPFIIHLCFHVALTCLLSHFLLAKIGIQHPDRVVETSTLSSVPPPDVTYTLSLPCSIIDRGLLSALQLEAIVYACQVSMSCRRTTGFLFFTTLFLIYYVCSAVFLSNMKLSYLADRELDFWLEMVLVSERGVLLLALS